MEVDKQMLLKNSELQLLIDSLLESSAELPLDILYTDPLPGNLVLALFADVVYTKKTDGETDQDYGNRLVLPDGWRLLVTGTNPNWINGYFGAAYVHAKSQQVVVAHRGTILSNTGALFTDAFGILGTQYTDCMNSAVTFMDQIRQAIHSANTQHGRSYNLSITGHSLGGWLAQVTAFTVKSLSINNGILEKNTRIGIHATTVVFDSPGASSMLDKVQDVYYDRYGMNVFFDRLNIMVCVSSPNRINTCGPHLGKVYRVFTEVSNLRWKDFALYNVKTHAMSNFVNAFKKNTEEISEVVDWAKDTAEYISLFEILNNANNIHQDLKNDHKILLEKLYWYNVSVTLNRSQKNDEIVKTYLNYFAEDELEMLYKLYVLQEQKTELRILDEFISKKNLKRVNSKIFPDFKIDLYNRIISCESRKSLDEVIKRLKQLMRWLGPQFTEAVEEQIATFPQSVDLVYRAEGRSYLDSLPKTTLNFNDSIGLREFLLSDTDTVLCIITQDGAFEMSRLQNIFAQIIENDDTSYQINKYTNESHYMFLDWPRLQKLIKIYGVPADQNHNLLIVDCSSSTALSSEVNTFLINHDHCSPPNLKKLVLLSSQPLDTFKSCYSIKTVPERKVNLMDLSDDSQKTLFKKNNLIFTGSRGRSFRDFLGDDCSVHEFNQIVNSDCLKSIVTNDAFVIKIKDTRPKFSDLQMPIYKINIKTSIECILRCIDSPNTLVVMSGMSRQELETGANWVQLAGKAFVLVDGDAELSFKDICNKNQHKSIYLLEVSEGDIYCKQIFDAGFYSPRKFRHRVAIDLRYFEFTKHTDDLIVVSSQREKTSFLGLIRKFINEKYLSKIVFIAATKEAELQIIHTFFNKNIHFVKITQGEGFDNIEWRYSHGSVESLRYCVSLDNYESVDELTLSKTERNLVVITDGPGMGKTTSLASLSRHIECAWVIYIDLKHFQVQIDRLSEKFTNQNVVSFLLSECCSQADGGLAHGLLEYVLERRSYSKRVVLMFDGFDKLDDYNQQKENSKEKLLRLIVFLVSNPTVQIFLTSRKYMIDSLEGKLITFSTSFEPISMEEKLNFLVVFWRSCLSFELRDYREEEEWRLNTRKYAKELLKEATRVLGPNIDSFVEVPLQLRMLAEVFRPQGKLLVQSLEVLKQQINVVTTPNLFKRFISLKYEIYLHDKTFKSRALDEPEITEYVESITKRHGELGFKIFFSDFYNANFDTISNEWLIKLNRHGLIETNTSGEFQFVHRSYAEYCCAQMVVHLLNKKECFFRQQLFKEILLPQILLQPSYKTLRLFMNFELKEKPMSKIALAKNAELLGRLWIEDRGIFKNLQNETALHIAAQELNEHVIALLIYGMNIEKMQEIFVSFVTQFDFYNLTALYSNSNRSSREHGLTGYKRNLYKNIVRSILQSTETCSFELKEKVILANSFNISYQHFLNLQELSPSSHEMGRVFQRVKKVLTEFTPFFDAISKNNLKLVRKILFKRLKNNVERYYFLVVKNKNRFGYPTALQFAAQCGHLSVVKLLLLDQTAVPFAELLAQHSGDGETLLLTASGHGALSIVQYLVEKHRADVNAFSKSGKTTLMFAASEGHLPIIAYLLERGANVNSVDEDGENALSKAAQKGHLNTVEYLAKHGADIHCTSRNGQTVLHKAAQRGHLPTVKFLVSRGAEVGEVDQMSRTAV